MLRTEEGLFSLLVTWKYLTACCCLAVTPRQLAPVPYRTVELHAHTGVMGEDSDLSVNGAQVYHVSDVTESFSLDS